MSRSGPLHHNRVARNVAPSCVPSWGYMSGSVLSSCVPRAARSAFRWRHDDASCSAATQRTPRQRCAEADRSTNTVQIANEDAIDLGASHLCTTPTVSSVEFAARATRSLSHERDMRRDCGHVHHVATCCRANGGCSHKRPRFIRTEPAAFRRASKRCESIDRVTDRRTHGYLFSSIRHQLWEMTSAGNDDFRLSR